MCLRQQPVDVGHLEPFQPAAAGRKDRVGERALFVNSCETAAVIERAMGSHRI